MDLSLLSSSSSTILQIAASKNAESANYIDFVRGIGGTCVCVCGFIAFLLCNFKHAQLYLFHDVLTRPERARDFVPVLGYIYRYI